MPHPNLAAKPVRLVNFEVKACTRHGTHMAANSAQQGNILASQMVMLARVKSVRRGGMKMNKVLGFKYVVHVLEILSHPAGAWLSVSRVQPACLIQIMLRLFVRCAAQELTQ